MKNYLFVLLLLMPYASEAQIFTKKADFPGVERWFGLSFAIGDKVYIGAGSDSTNPNGDWISKDMKNDLWQYNTLTNSWVQKNNLPFTRRNRSSAFVVNGVAYAGLGYDTTFNSRNDWWKYNESSDTWTQLADFPGGDRYYAFSFSWNGKGYIIGGYSFKFIDTSFHRACNDFWEYNPATNAWTQLPGFPGAARGAGFCEVVGNNLYLGLGANDSAGTYLSDNFKCDLQTMTWSAMAAIPPTGNVPVVEGITSFSAHAGSKIMVMNIDITYTILNDLKTSYIYNTVNNTWTLYSMGNTPGWRLGGVCAQVGNKAYAGLGTDYYSWIWPLDYWEVNLTNLISDVENTNPDLQGIVVSSFEHTIHAQVPASLLRNNVATMSVYNVEGKKCFDFPLNATNSYDLKGSPSGSYSYIVSLGGKYVKSGLVMLY